VSQWCQNVCFHREVTWLLRTQNVVPPALLTSVSAHISSPSSTQGLVLTSTLHKKRFLLQHYSTSDIFVPSFPFSKALVVSLPSCITRLSEILPVLLLSFQHSTSTLSVNVSLPIPPGSVTQR